uniref:Uncharacterized protein n=1 Tax=Cryptomonas curvata TaxID=233186 RepID=A0A7S0MWU5_9CRYP
MTPILGGSRIPFRLFFGSGFLCTTTALSLSILPRHGSLLPRHGLTLFGTGVVAGADGDCKAAATLVMRGCACASAAARVSCKSSLPLLLRVSREYCKEKLWPHENKIEINAMLKKKDLL